MSLNKCMDVLLNIPPTWSGSRTKGWWGFSILLAIRCNTPLSLERRLHLVWTPRSFNVARQQKADKCTVSRFRKAHKILWHWLVNRYESSVVLLNLEENIIYLMEVGDQRRNLRMKVSCFKDNSFIHLYYFFSLIFANKLRFWKQTFRLLKIKNAGARHRYELYNHKNKGIRPLLRKKKKSLNIFTPVCWLHNPSKESSKGHWNA